MPAFSSPPPHPLQHTSMAAAANGMVASAQPLAAAAGLQVLMEGGNAFDAAVAAAFVEDVTLPAMTTLGGDSYSLLYEKASNKVYALNGSGAAPTKASIAFFENQGGKLPLEGVLSSSVPGEVHALLSIHQRFGTMPLERLLRPAIQYAEQGFPVNERLRWRIAGVEQKLRRYAASAEIFLPGGKLPEVGDMLVQSNLAETLKIISQYGAAGFYSGAIGEQIAAYMQKSGGLIGLDDLTAHESEFTEPISTTYKGYKIYETTPPSQGLIVLEMLNILEGYPLAEYGLGSAEAIHAMIEAKKLAYSDRLKYCGDPRFVKFDLEHLLSKEYALKLQTRIDPSQAMSHRGGLVETIDGDTTYLTVVDRDGNCISFIHSLSGVEFGSGEVAGNTGIVMNSRLGRGFSLNPAHPNALMPGKRTMHTINAYMVFEDGHPRWMGGTPGGDQQPQWNVQVITNLIDFGLNVQQAAEYPRWFSYPGTDEPSLTNPFELKMENRFPQQLYQLLKDKGHQLSLLGPWAGGGVQLIEINRRSGVLLGGSDPRIGGIALGF